jgi:hypothetical protein
MAPGALGGVAGEKWFGEKEHRTARQARQQGSWQAGKR